MQGLLNGFPDTGQPLRALAQQLLRGPSPLSPGERETIAAFVSARNRCTFCHESHAAAARHLPGGEAVDAVCADLDASPVSGKMKALLAIAEKVRQDGRLVKAVDIAAAHAEGATDREVHDTVLIAAAFCMFNRYVDGLSTFAPAERSAYDQMGARLAQQGYLQPSGPA